MEKLDNENMSLPENAQRELAPGEVYKPILSAEKNYKEVTVWSVTIGLLMTILFSAAAAYLGLKVGQVFEAAIPIAIIAIGLSGVAKKNDALSQNVIIQSIGGCSGGVVAGAIFNRLPDSVFPLYFLILCFVFYSATRLPKASGYRQKGEKGSVFDVLKDKEILLVLLLTCVQYTTMAYGHTFLGPYMLALGGNSALIGLAKNVLETCIDLLGFSAPDKM